MGTFGSPRPCGRLGRARTRRCLDIDGGGIFGGLALEAVLLPFGPESGCAFSACAGDFIPSDEPVSNRRRKQAGPKLGLLD